jgi:molybdate transport system substrate-binding protein
MTAERTFCIDILRVRGPSSGPFPRLSRGNAWTRQTLDKLGITQELKPKIKWVSTGGVVQDAVAKGEYEIAFGPYLSDMRNPGLDVVGALPPEASTPVDITGFLSTSVTDPKAARALLDYLSSPEVAPVYESAKIFPVR